MVIVDPHRLLDTLRALPSETEWLEFKLNRFDPTEVGKYISALANSAILHGQDRGFLVFGIDDVTHDIVGTRVRLKDSTVGGDLFENWLARMLHPRITCEFVSLMADGQDVEMIVIDPAFISPVRFKNEAYIRVGSSLQKLNAHPERERQLWHLTSRLAFEHGIAAHHFTTEQVLATFDCHALLSGLRSNKDSQSAVIEELIMDEMLIDDKQGGLDVTNLLAVLAAKNLSDFPLLARKAPRVVRYADNTKLRGLDDITGRRGYGIAFRRLLAYIMEKVPHREEMVHGLRQTIYVIPELAVREFVANALIHQDLTSTGDGPLIEIFTDRIRITNPGKPLVSPDRFIDAPPKSRNESLAAVMRKMGFCEERGSGVDRAVDAIERAALPPPLFQEVENSTVVTVFGQRSFAAMTKEERIRACYQHACLNFESGSRMSNASLRARFGLSDKQYPQVSAIIREAIDEGMIRPLDEDQGNRNARYVPFWA